MNESAPHWPAEAVWPPRRLTDAEAKLPSHAWWLQTSDGYRHAVLSWLCAAEPPKASVVVLHGVQSHAGWYHGLGRRLAAAGFDAHFPDRRGSGANRQARGHAPSAHRLIEDLVELLRRVRGGELRPAAIAAPRVLAGISWGGKLAVVTAARRPELVDAVMLICPGLHPRVGVSGRERLGVALALLTGQGAKRTFLIPLADPTLFTADPTAQAFIAADPLSLRAGTAGLMFASRLIDAWVARSPRKLRQSVLLLLAEHDRIVDNERTRAYFDQIASAEKELVVLRDTHHTPEFDARPEVYARVVTDWLDARVALLGGGSAQVNPPA
jgi:alpha-beta hydrolase superfamily lysophospholipase